MPDFHVTQEKINELLEELRSWDAGEEKLTLHELADKFGLDVFVVDRIVRSEGLRVKAGYRPEERDNTVDPNASTLDLDPSEIEEALSKPDPNPDYSDDVDTGVWKKKPTGEWERIPPGYTKDEDEDED
jgi:hypothetical protein